MTTSASSVTTGEITGGMTGTTSFTRMGQSTRADWMNIAMAGF